MKQLELRDTREFRRGREFEQEVARQMILRGYHVSRCYDQISTDTRYSKAPMLDGPLKGLRLPDLQACKFAKTTWRECKEKDHSDYTHSRDSWDHGINLACYRDYLEVQKNSGLEVLLMIGEWQSGLILIQSLEKLGEPRLYTDHKMGPDGMAFWPRERFYKWGRWITNPGQGELLPGSRRTIEYEPGKLH